MTRQILLTMAPALALAALASCGASNRAANDTQEGGNVESATLAKLGLTSDAFQDGQVIPTQYTCLEKRRPAAMFWKGLRHA